MDARKAIQRSVAIAAIAVGFGVFTASPVHTYGGDFNLQIPAQLDSSKDRMAEPVEEITGHSNISDLNVSTSLQSTIRIKIVRGSL